MLYQRIVPRVIDANAKLSRVFFFVASAFIWKVAFHMWVITTGEHNEKNHEAPTWRMYFSLFSDGNPFIALNSHEATQVGVVLPICRVC